MFLTLVHTIGGECIISNIKRAIVILIILLLYIVISFYLLYADFPSFSSLSLITGDFLLPDLVFVARDSSLYMMELTLGFEFNVQINGNRKSSKCKTLIIDRHSTYYDVKFVNVSMGVLEISVGPSDSLLSVFNDFDLDINSQRSHKHRYQLHMLRILLKE